MSSLFVIGAGFSKQANFPLGYELFPEVIQLAKERRLYTNTLKPDIDIYLQYISDTGGHRLSEDEINFEDFISYLDIEHFLWLKGSDTMTEDGNRSQLAIRNLIALALYLKLESITDADLDLYRTFVRNLEPGDLIISFNYDTLLEMVFEELGIPYRLFPTRLVNAGTFDGEVKYPEEEVVLLKVHGSIDWFDKTRFIRDKKDLRERCFDMTPRHPVFKDPSETKPNPIIDCPYFDDDPLTRIYRVSELGNYFSKASFLLESPLLISPSSNKIVYINPIRDFWYGFNRRGVGYTRMAIIGFSLPKYDEYIRQPLYHVITNYQYKDVTPLDNKKSSLVMVDFRTNEELKNDYRRSYRFVNWGKTVEHYTGFNEEAIDKIFQ